MFFVNPEQNKIIEEAISKTPAQPEKTKTQQRADALTRIAEHFISQTAGGLTDAQK
jgi:hypothetical protein